MKNLAQLAKGDRGTATVGIRPDGRRAGRPKGTAVIDPTRQTRSHRWTSGGSVVGSGTPKSRWGYGRMAAHKAEGSLLFARLSLIGARSRRTAACLGRLPLSRHDITGPQQSFRA